MGESSCVSCGECMVSCPTGALTNRLVTQTKLPRPLIPNRCHSTNYKTLPFFEGCFRNILEPESERHGAAGISNAGEIICREGEYGSTAFYILEGQARRLHLPARSHT